MAAISKMSYAEEVVQHEMDGRKITHHDIARVALRIYEEEGCPEGRAEAHWLEAERRLLGGGNHDQASAQPCASR